MQSGLMRTRIRNVCHDSTKKTRNCLKLGVTNGSYQYLEKLTVRLIGPSCPAFRPLPETWPADCEGLSSREVPRNSSSVPGFPLICLVDGLSVLLSGRLALFVYPRRPGCSPLLAMKR
jgi:hypothetical protein